MVQFPIIKTLAECLVKDSVPSFAVMEYLLFLAMDMRTRVRRFSWFDGLDALQPLGNYSHVRQTKCRRLLTNLVYTMQGIRRDQQRTTGQARFTHLGILECLVSASEGGLDRHRCRVNLTSSWGRAEGGTRMRFAGYTICRLGILSE
jgi:hypothetical protein